MNRSSVIIAAIVIMLFVCGNLFAGVISALPPTVSGDSRSLRWDRFDVEIDNLNTSANQFDVAEIYDLAIELGPFYFGTAEIPLDRVDRIDNVVVYDGGTRLQESCYSSSGSYCVTDDGENLSIKYYFRSPADTGTRRDIRIEYTVHGALRSYKDGDQLYWVAVPADRPFPVRDSKVTVTLPQGLAIQKTATYPGTWKETISGNVITWTAPGSLGNNGSVEVRVQYPHDPKMKAPAWQAGFDRQRWYEDHLQPVVSLLMVVLAVLLAIGGVLFVYITYVRQGRDPAAVVVPEYLTEAPSDELPGVVGVLLDERADMQDIMGTLVDLARRGYFTIEQTENSSMFGLFSSTGFTFHRSDKPAEDLTGYEETLLRGLFPGHRTDTDLSDLREKFYTHIPAIKQQLYTEAVRRGYFTRSPESTRTLWTVIGIAGLVLGTLGFWFGHALAFISPLIVLPPLGLGVGGAAALLSASYMPGKTAKGSQEAARWRAFRRYLGNVEHYDRVANAADKFEQYIGYAVAFGMERHWIEQVAPAMTSMPTWYYPTYLGGPWGRGYYGRPMTMGGGDTARGMGDFKMGGPGGLNDMSQSLSQGLNAMSSGMTRMLNDASRVMTSAPKSSGSGGHGGFSGGGGGGGGGSGGGSRGFG